MSILDNNPSFTYVNVKNLVVIFEGMAYGVDNMYTNQKYIYWDKSTPNILIESNIRLEQTSTRFLIIINNKGISTVMPHDEITLSFDSGVSFGSGGGDISRREFESLRQEVSNNTTKYNTVSRDVDKITTILGDETKLEDGTLVQNINAIKQSSTSMESTIRELQETIKDEFKDIRDAIAGTLTAYMTGLSELNITFNSISKDNTIDNEEITTMTDSINKINSEYNDIITCIDKLKEIMTANAMTDEITVLEERLLSVDTSRNNVINIISNVISDKKVTTTEMTTVTQAVAAAGIDVGNLKAYVDEIVTLGLGGTVYDEFSKISQYKNEISMEVHNIEQNEKEIKDTFTQFQQTANGFYQKVEEHTETLASVTGDINNIKEKIDKTVSNIDTYYSKSTDEFTPGTNWSTDIPTYEDGYFIWSKVVTTYTDGTTSETDPIKFGVNGEDGVGIDKIEQWYYSSTSNTELLNGTWSTIKPQNKSGRFIWTKQRIYYSNGTTSETSELCVTGEPGSNGTNPASLRLNSSTYVVAYDTDGNPKTTNDIVLTAIQQNYTDELVWSTSEVVTLNGNGNTRTIIPSDFNSYDKVIITVAGGGLSDSVTIVKVVDGEEGSDAYTIVLSNEAHTFRGDSTSAVSQSTTCDVIAYKGATRVPCTIGTITGMPIGMTIPTHSNNGTTAARFTVNVATSMTTESGVLNVPVTVDDITFTKQFSYTLALSGSDAKSLDLYSSSYAVLFDNNNNPKNKNKITINAVARNLNGTIGWSVSPSDVTLTTSSNTSREIDPSSFKKYESITVTASCDTYSDTITIVKVKDGDDGSGVDILGSYDTEAELLAAHPSGNNNGDAYIVGIDMYIWTGSEFKNVGQFRGKDGLDGNDAYTVILSNESHVFPGDTNSANPGSTKCYVIGYKGTTQMPCTIGKITGMPTGMNIPAHGNNNTNNAYFTVNVTEDMTTKNGTLNIPVTIDGKVFNKTFSYSIAFTGGDGVGINKIDDEFIQTNSATTPPSTNDTGWSTTAPKWVSGKYIWRRTKTYYTNNNTTTSNPVCITGEKGESPRYLSLDASTYVVGIDKDGTIKDTTQIELNVTEENFDMDVTWSTNPSVTLSGTNNRTKTIDPSIFKTIDKVTVTVTASNMSDSVTIVKVKDGEFAYNAVLSNQAHTFLGDTEKAIAAKTTSYVYGYDGTSRVVTNIGTITGTPTGMTVSIKNNNTNNAYFEVSVTTSMKTKSGVLKVPVTINSHLITLDFSYTLALKGEWGTGVESIEEEYNISNSKDTAPTTGWSTTQPTWEYGKYLWIRNKITYNNPTSVEYTEPYCDTTWEAVKDLECADRNLIKNSAFIYDQKPWKFTSGVKIDTNKTHYSRPSLNIVKTGLTSNAYAGAKNYEISDAKTLNKDEVYTLSAWYYVENISTIDNGIGIEIKGCAEGASEDSNIIPIHPTELKEKEWCKVTKTVKITKKYNNCFVYAWVRRNGTVWFTDFKLAKGNKVGDWSPAPEDTEERLTTVITKVSEHTQTLDEITDKVARVETTANEAKSTATEAKQTASGFTNKVTSIEDTVKGHTEKISKIEQTNSSIKSSVSELQNMGNRNLLYNTEFKNFDYWDASRTINCGSGDSGIVDSTITPNGNASFRIDEYNHTTDKWHGYTQMISGGLVPGETYTLSGYYKVFNAVSGVNCLPDRGIGIEIKGTKDSSVSIISTFEKNTFDKIGEWVKFSMTFTYPYNYTNPFVAVWVKRNGRLYTGDLMLVKGSASVNWMPSPSDTDHYSESLVTQTSNAITYEFKTHMSNPNLVKNGCPTYSNQSHWWISNSESGGVAEWCETDNTYLSFSSKNVKEVFLWHEYFGVKPNTTYSISFWVKKESNVSSYDVFIVESHTSGEATYTKILSSITTDGWCRYKINHTTSSTTKAMTFRFDHNGLINPSTASYVTVNEVMVFKGKDYFPDTWYPAPEEIMSNTTKINGDGVEVKHADNSRTLLDSSALKFYDNANTLYSQVKDGKLYYNNTDGTGVGFVGRNYWTGTSTYLSALNAEYGHCVGLGAKFDSNSNQYQTNIIVSSKQQTLGGCGVRQGLNLLNPWVKGGIVIENMNSYDEFPAFITANTSRDLLIASDGSVKICSWAGHKDGNNVGYEAKKETVSPWVSNHMYGNLYMHNWAIYNSGWVNPVSAASSASFRLKAIDSTDYSSPYSEDITNFYGTSSTTNGEVRYTDRETHITSKSLKYDDNGNILKDESGNYVYEDVPSCIIEIPYYMAENIEDSYHVNITPAEFGFYRVKEKNRYYFVVESQDDGFPFTFEVVAKRLEVPQGNNAIVANIQNAYDPNIVEAEIEGSVITDV